MSIRRPHPPSSVVDEAIARVVAAEADAAAAVAQAQAEADAMVEQARSAARAIEACTERRIAAARARFERHVVEQVAALDAQAAALDTDHEPNADDLAAIERAARAMAAKLTGADAT